jgi:hypothetical protein
MTTKLTAATLRLFDALVEDAPNWSGTPLVDVGAAGRGHLTHLKRAGLLTTTTSDGDVFAVFTPAGRALALERAADRAPAGPSDADVAEACRRLSAEMSTPQFAAALAACESITDDQEVAMPTANATDSAIDRIETGGPATDEEREAYAQLAAENADLDAPKTKRTRRPRNGRQAMADGVAAAAKSPVTPDGQQASVVAIEAAAASRLAAAKPAATPDAKPATTRRKKTGTSTRQKPATTTVKPAKTTLATSGRAAERESVKPRTPAQQAAANAKAAATKRAKSVQALLSAGKVERNAITEAVAKHGDLHRAAKDAGVDVATVEQRLRPGKPSKTGATRSKADYVALFVRYAKLDGDHKTRLAALAADRPQVLYAIWLAGLRPDQKNQPAADRSNALRAAVADKLGKSWPDVVKALPVGGAK